MEFDFSGFSEVVKKSLTILLGDQIPEYISKTLAIFVIIFAILIVTYSSTWLISNTFELFNEKIKPYFYDNQRKRRQIRRQRFAEYVESEINRLNNQESWEDYRFTELEAEIEAQGRQRKWLSFWTFEEKLSREKSLSKALNKSNEKVILLEGDPGSGKSVALRHLALKLSKKASKSRNIKTVLPIYINLKGLERSDQDVDRNFIKDYIYKTLNRANSRDIDVFLEKEFYRGLEEGTWLFLFDSFDEIPEVLGSVEADEKIQNYAEAISDFLGVFNQCRGIISSREYRGPKILNVSKFRILPLSEIRQKRLIKNIDLDGIETSKMIGELGVSSHGLRSMASNPMFLSLLCEYVSQNRDFPKNSYLVYEKYIDNRLKRDSERLARRFNLTSDEVRFAAESLAYCMTAEDNLGLNPSRKDLLTALEKYDLSLGNFPNRLLDALEFLKIARTDGEAIRQEEKNFTFAHRRFQEYFVTSVILNEPNRVTHAELLTNGKWRETTVVLLQTQPKECLCDLLDSATDFLESSAKRLNCLGYAQTAIFSPEYLTENAKKLVQWPKNLLHILSILQDGLVGDEKGFSARLQGSIDDLLSFATIQGTLLDRKLSLEVSGIATGGIQEKMLEIAFMTNSQWINDIAYTQTSYLTSLNPFLRECIRYSLLRKAYSGNLYQHIHSSKTFIQRLNNIQLTDAFKLASNIPLIDFLGKSISLFVLLFLRRRTFLSFFDSHYFYELITDSFISFFFVALTLTSIKLIPRKSNTNKKLVPEDLLDTFILFSLLIFMFIFISWLYWRGESSPGSGSSGLPFPISHLGDFLFDEAINFEAFAKITWLLLGTAFYGFLWKKKAIINLELGQYLKWYWWPFYQALIGWNVLFEGSKLGFSLIKEVLINSVNFPFFLISIAKKAVRNFSRQNKQKKFQILLLIIASFLVVYFWRVFFPVTIVLLSFYVIFYSILHIFLPLLLWGMLAYLEHDAEMKMRELSRKRRERFFQEILEGKKVSLALILEGLERRDVLDSESFYCLIDFICENLHSDNVNKHDIECIKLLALQIENFHDSSPSHKRFLSKDYFRRFKAPFINKNMIEVLDFLGSSGVFIPSKWFARWEYSLFMLSDVEELQAFSGSMKVNLSDLRFVFLRDLFWVERLYIILEKVEKT